MYLIVAVFEPHLRSYFSIACYSVVILYYHIILLQSIKFDEMIYSLTFSIHDMLETINLTLN